MIQAIPKKKTQQFFSVTTIPNIFEWKIREYPTLSPVRNESSTQPPLRYKELESPSLHLEQVYKTIGEQGRLQIMVEKFTGQVARWWDTQQSRLQTWTTTST